MSTTNGETKFGTYFRDSTGIAMPTNGTTIRRRSRNRLTLSMADRLSGMMRTPVVYLVAMLACPAWGQEFEVVSVKPNKSGDGGSSTRSDQGRLMGTNVSLRNMIVMAYGMKDYQVEGPAWLSGERFDINAKFQEALSKN